ncbi:hypothetical protein SKAU_G00273190 [Synaphobranchus kaupii]|uniref:Uncharacterized protein n=1 Tax=Synaphobranchus kaupii TaxID=118154 RepID=A0A9Q1F0Q1_SYNKA|nr:hypothetical protein SKAU_G00273190 [Synaphobranchus kaupii]
MRARQPLDGTPALAHWRKAQEENLGVGRGDAAEVVRLPVSVASPLCEPSGSHAGIMRLRALLPAASPQSAESLYVQSLMLRRLPTQDREGGRASWAMDEMRPCPGFGSHS